MQYYFLIYIPIQISPAVLLESFIGKGKKGILSGPESPNLK